MRTQRFSLVITRLGKHGLIPKLPWLETDCGVCDADWIVLTDESWRAIAVGDEPVRAEFDRKLLVTSYLKSPEFIAVVGCPARDDETESSRLWHTQRVTDHVRSCLLPVDVQGFWISDRGDVEPVDALASCGTTDGELVTNEQN
jgi:hypothetical protein